MGKAKTAGGVPVIDRDGDGPCVERRQKLAEKIADLLAPLVEGSVEDVVIIVSNHTGTSVLGHANTKWAIIEAALRNNSGTPRH